jgi:hypothetical protein
VRLLRRPIVRTQIEVAGSDKPIVAQDVPDMSDGATIEEKSRRHSVTRHVRGHGLLKSDYLSESPEPNQRRLESHRVSTPTDCKKRLAMVLAPGHVDLIGKGPTPLIWCRWSPKNTIFKPRRE